MSGLQELGSSGHGVDDELDTLGGGEADLGAGNFDGRALGAEFPDRRIDGVVARAVGGSVVAARPVSDAVSDVERCLVPCLCLLGASWRCSISERSTGPSRRPGRCGVVWFSSAWRTVATTTAAR